MTLLMSGSSCCMRVSLTRVLIKMMTTTPFTLEALGSQMTARIEPGC